MEIFAPIFAIIIVSLLVSLPTILLSGNDHYEEPKDE